MKLPELLRHIAGNVESKEDLLEGLCCPTDAVIEDIWSSPELFTLKPITHIVSGFEVPAPMVEAGDYWMVNKENLSVLGCFSWSETLVDLHRLKHGLCFATKEHAELNRKAQLGINPYEAGE